MTSQWAQLPLPNATWHHEPDGASFDAESGELTIPAPGKTDWNVDAMTDDHVDSAPALLAAVDGDFSLSAQVTVDFRDTYDAGVLCIRQSSMSWAKLCFEFTPQGAPMIVSVVTNGHSDDANSAPIDDNVVRLRVVRLGAAYAFHYSRDGEYWHFVRQFRMRDDCDARIGFLAQSPVGDGSSAVFSDIRHSTIVPNDLRHGE